MSLPAQARHRWGLEDGGEVAWVDYGDAIMLVPGTVEEARRDLLNALTDEDWQAAREGFGDPDLATK
jgi:dihydroneopterin aldolase